MTFFSEESLLNGFERFKSHIVVISKVFIFITDLVLFAICMMLFVHSKHPGLGVYVLFLCFGILSIELIVPLISSQSNQLRYGIRDMAESATLWMTPLKKSVVYALVALPMFVNLTIAVLGAVLLLIAALFFAGQYDDSNASEDEETGPITGISAGDVVIPVEFPPAELIPGTLTLQPAAFTGTPREEPLGSPEPGDWDFAKSDDMLLLG